ncbi:MAG: MFS family permease [Candidatus Azotimanducaceae bacterium]|jgi:MFS family permease
MKLSGDLRWYLVSTGFYLVPGGIQAVLFPWMIAVYLDESAAKVGFAQMAGPLPMLFLILFGGWLGDRVDQRRLSLILVSFLTLPPIVVAGLFYFESVTYELLIVWVLLLGSVGAFAQPARDAMLNRVAGPNIQQVVILVIGVQFAIQILGFGIGSSADLVGPEIVLLTMSAFMCLCALATFRLPPMPVDRGSVGSVSADNVSVDKGSIDPEASSNDPARKSPLSEIKEGLAVAWQSDQIKPSIILIFGVGLFFASTYMVILPLMVRDIFDGGARGIALAYASNMLGTCTVIFFLMRRGGVDWPGRALILTGISSSFVVSCLHFELSELAFYFVIYIWGLCGGVSITLTRAIVQEASPPTHRARIMSVFMLGMMGGMPIGAASIGLLVEAVGVRNAVLVPGVGMLVILLYLYLTTSLYDIRRAPVIAPA